MDNSRETNIIYYAIAALSMAFLANAHGIAPPEFGPLTSSNHTATNNETTLTIAGIFVIATGVFATVMAAKADSCSSSGSCCLFNKHRSAYTAINQSSSGSSLHINN